MLLGYDFFHDSILLGKVFQEGVQSSDASLSLFCDQPVVAAVEFRPPVTFFGDVKAFIQQFSSTFLENIELSIAVNSSSTLEDIPCNDLCRNTDNATAAGRKILTKSMATSTGLMLYKVTRFHFADQFLNTPLVLSMTINLVSTRAKQFKELSRMDLCESNVRALLDLSRHRPTRTASRKVTLPITISHPVTVFAARTREVDATTSLLSVTVRNNHHAMSLQCRDLQINVDRTNQEESGGGAVTEEVSHLRVPQHQVVERTDSDTGGHCDRTILPGLFSRSVCASILPAPCGGPHGVEQRSLTVLPRESLSVVFRITTDTTFATSSCAAAGRFISPFCMFWSLRRLSGKRAKQTGSDSTWSPTLLEVLACDDAGEEVPLERLVGWSRGTASIGRGRAVPSLTATLRGPLSAGVGMPFVVSASVTNTSSSHSSTTSPAYMTTAVVQCSDVVESDADCVVLESRTAIREALSLGETAVVPLTVLALSPGAKTISDVQLHYSREGRGSAHRGFRAPPLQVLIG